MEMKKKWRTETLMMLSREPSKNNETAPPWRLELIVVRFSIFFIFNSLVAGCIRAETGKREEHNDIQSRSSFFVLFVKFLDQLHLCHMLDVLKYLKITKRCMKRSFNVRGCFGSKTFAVRAAKCFSISTLEIVEKKQQQKLMIC